MRWSFEFGAHVVHNRTAYSVFAATVVGLLVAPLVLRAQQESELSRPTERTESCSTMGCHTPIVSQPVMHGPVVQGQCTACHDYVDPAKHTFMLTETPEQLCIGCHDLDQREHMHQPVVEGDCTACHDPHGSEHKMMMVADPGQGLCLTCHDQAEDMSKRFVHGPVALGACIMCHEAHTSDHENLLIKNSRELCVACHTEIDQSRDKAGYNHQPVEDDCRLCHDAHASDVRGQLHTPAPELCFGCHADVQDGLENGVSVHGALTQEGGCLICHSAHHSPEPALQRMSQPESCLACHDGSIEREHGLPATNMKALLADNPSHHGPIREGDCSACHRPHTSDHARLLNKSYPPEFYAPFDEERYELCFECHVPDLVLDESGTGLTEFRDGDQNLHFVHVQNRGRGNSCSTCHAVHGSNQGHHIARSVFYSGSAWKMKLEYTPKAKGGTCTTDCHEEIPYSRDAPDLIDEESGPKKKPEKNPRKEEDKK